MKNISLVILFLFYAVLSVSSQDIAKGHFLVEFEKFSPPIQDMVLSFEGHKAEPFLANDVNGKEHYLDSYKGKKVILWFWSVEDYRALDQVGAMTLLQQEMKPSLKIIAFAKEPKARVQEYLRQNPMDIDVIPNGEVFGQMAYGAEMGNPRMFIIDQYGIIKAALPNEAFIDNANLYISLESILNGF